ncbi:hypothetical protein ACJO1Y_05325 [Vibrio parahaemolyticus]|uniref:hypothetical protein n=2 Tax=Vibrio parahaemolyticus TaxID=670 RepID=UPI001D35C1C9|nr:hypothetical protein [Vibrio parahaemolyticus]EHQ9269905.1 hypothetical protein [Vibrio parahaemolyticus]EIC5077064.1 hypothetical protein [Vibrio parahaemolyticus]MDG2668834.1 hypothetical protein [Vibrio parahaemolyticus]MDG2789708.1 hypothetical protein [Vibrio parahaemolyticus]
MRNLKYIVLAQIVIVLVGSYLILFGKTITLEDSEVVTALIALFGTLGALISATFVVASYMQTNNAYIESQRPHLLILAESLTEKGTAEPVTCIHYHNITNSRFTDLTITVVLEAENRKVNLSHLFRSNMTMIGRDQRQRNFKILDEATKLGLDIESTAMSGREVKLLLGYEYTFNDAKEHVGAQEYIWDANSREWRIN